jgi:hypothetical protein
MLFHFSCAKVLFIRSNALVNLSLDVAKDNLTKPSPRAPNSLPGTTATLAFSSSILENSIELNPNLDMFGKA